MFSEFEKAGTTRWATKGDGVRYSVSGVCSPAHFTYVRVYVVLYLQPSNIRVFL